MSGQNPVARRLMVRLPVARRLVVRLRVVRRLVVRLRVVRGLGPPASALTAPRSRYRSWLLAGRRAGRPIGRPQFAHSP